MKAPLRHRQRMLSAMALATFLAGVQAFTQGLGEAAARGPQEPSVAERLAVRARLGPTYLSYGKKTGISAVAADGKWNITLSPGPIRAAALDPALDLLWFLRKDKLMVLDLRDKQLEPVVIVSKWPKRPHAFSVQGISNVMAGQWADLRNYLELVWEPEGNSYVSVTSGGIRAAFYQHKRNEPPQDNEVSDDVSHFFEGGEHELAGAAWLISQAQRPSRPAKAPAPPIQDGTSEHRALVDLQRRLRQAHLVNVDESLPFDPVESGSFGDPFGATGWYELLVYHPESDVPEYGCVLFDPKTQLFARAEAPAVWQAELPRQSECDVSGRFDSSGTYYLLREQVCTVHGCTSSSRGAPLGWWSPYLAGGDAARMSAEELASLCGSTSAEPRVQELLARLGPDFVEELTESGRAGSYNWKHKGVSILFARSDGVSTLQSVIMYAHGADDFSCYPSEWPSGILPTDTRRDVEAKLGRPDDSGGNGIVPFWVRYSKLGLNITYVDVSMTEMANSIHHIRVFAPR